MCRRPDQWRVESQQIVLRSLARPTRRPQRAARPAPAACSGTQCAPDRARRCVSAGFGERLLAFLSTRSGVVCLPKSQRKSKIRRFSAVGAAFSWRRVALWFHAIKRPQEITLTVRGHVLMICVEGSNSQAPLRLGGVVFCLVLASCARPLPESIAVGKNPFLAAITLDGSRLFVPEFCTGQRVFRRELNRFPCVPLLSLPLVTPVHDFFCTKSAVRTATPPPCDGSPNTAESRSVQQRVVHGSSSKPGRGCHESRSWLPRTTSSGARCAGCDRAS